MATLECGALIGAECMPYPPNAVWSIPCLKKRVSNDRVNFNFKPQLDSGIIGGKFIPE
jgi:hypothetical protein